MRNAGENDRSLLIALTRFLIRFDQLRYTQLCTRSHQPALLHRRGDKAREQRMRLERTALQLRVILHAFERP